ncbi:glycosyltransferase family 4 protein [Aquabacterium sp. A7-Y]|uniref:glycosyltransferase family 4 protein n=1 Tax=Aquabacterium sp. A7-Y TaxID=1349605 RepID=UPI00223E6DDE|nr:glycosyltransferase family 4 protein [Aquabacterium sp. A7-Y]MCW7542135.1 glycosyltransferase family 4 protein [Aquabacterium sp. A7-Y]
MSAAARRCAFVVPGDLATRTGGYRYDARIVEGLRTRGWRVDVVSLDGDFPWPDRAALDGAEAALAALPDGLPVVVDGLAFGVLPESVARHAARLRWLALVHHPLALETGLSEARRAALFDSEGRALAAARRVVVTSAATARALAAYAVPAPRIAVVEPGTDPAPLARGSGAASGGPALLCVATLTPRKGHRVLLDALAGLQERPWTLHCVGSLERDAETARALRRAIVAHGLEARVQLYGEVDEARLQALYDAADLFVLASFHEGYGMALAEALARGLPVVASDAGAIAGTVPREAGLLVPPGDVAALREALMRWLERPALRAELSAGARGARERLPSWSSAAARFATVLEEL